MYSDSVLLKEINEQPEALQRLIKIETKPILDLGEKLRSKFSYMLIAARGTSDNAARYAQYLFQMFNKLPVALATPSVFSVYKSPPNLADALVLAISQSGSSPDIIAVVKEAHAQGRPTLAITNNIESPLAKAADEVIGMHVGEEKAVAATKTYTASLTALALLSYGLLGDAEILAEIEKIPEKVAGALENTLTMIEQMQRYRFMTQCAVIGRGYNYSTAFEASLKIKELTGIIAEPYSSADFLHGPIATVHRGFPVLAVAHKGMVFADMVEIISKVKALGAELITISDSREVGELAQLPISIPEGVPEWLSPIVNVVPGQILGWQLALQKGMDPDNPAGLSKVTLTV